MRKLLFVLSVALVLTTACSDDNDDNNNNGGGNNTGRVVPNDYSGVYSGDILSEAQGFFGNDTLMEPTSVRIYKDDAGHYIFSSSPVSDDSVKVYFDENGIWMVDESVNQMGTVTEWEGEATIDGTELDIYSLVISSVPAAQVEIGRAQATGVLTKE